MFRHIALRLLLITMWAWGALMWAPRADARVVPPRVDELARKSELIVVAKVQSVSGKSDDDDRRAKATVSEVWKGPKATTVEYHASPTWACDIAHAEPGETVLLFLTDNEKDCWRIAWVGRGRMPVKSFKGRDYARPFMDVIFPKGTESTPLREGDDSGFDRAYELAAVKKLVRKAVDGKE